jgi:glucosamine 6-phosphate synthetase-like amidotransferase/phosphosugar isomerase protein
MCGIFGSTDSERFKTLYELNKDRGSFAYGGMYIHREEVSEIQRSEGDSLQLEDRPGRQYYMGHTQAPTSAQREFDPETSHPFQYHTWYVAHNGVLSNSEVLAEQYGVHPNPVDSAVIPAMMWYYHDDNRDDELFPFQREELAIKAVCEKLEGTFSCWVHNTITNHVYLIRSGSTLFVNYKTGDFSSAQYEDMEPLDNHAIYRVFYDADPIQKSKIEKVGHFDTHSPFFIL